MATEETVVEAIKKRLANGGDVGRGVKFSQALTDLQRNVCTHAMKKRFDGIELIYLVSYKEIMEYVVLSATRS